MKAYKYKYIICFESCGRWYADYSLGRWGSFALHRLSCATKKECYELAKAEVDYLNEKGRS